MSDIVIVDTSVLLNVLDIPAFNQNRAEVFAEFNEFLDSGASFLLPMAAIFETGDHGVSKLKLRTTDGDLCEWQ